MKKIWLIFFVIVVILVSGQGCEQQQIIECVPAQCCHPTSCVLKDKAPDCDGMMCTMECKPGTMDCNQGQCEYINGKCEAISNGE